MKVKDIPEYFSLAQNSDDTDFYNEYLNTSTYYPYLFLAISDGEVLEAYGSWSACMDEVVYKVK